MGGIPLLQLLCCCRFVVLFLSYTIPAAAQDFTIPSSWKNTTVSLNKSQIQALALNAASELSFNIDQSLGSINGIGATQSASMIAALALQDWLNRSTTWHALTQNSLQIYNNEHPTYANSLPFGSFDTDSMSFGLAALYAYRAYNDTPLLDIAIQNWEMTATDMITIQDDQTGRLPRTGNVSTPCTNIAGAIFKSHSPSDNLEIDSLMIGNFVALSAYLFEITKNSTYLNMAELTAQFATEHLILPNALVADNYNVTNCSATGIFSFDTGDLVEGLSVLANVTNAATWQQALIRLVGAIAGAPWNTVDGRVNENRQDGRGGWIIRGLLEARNRNIGTSMAAFIEGYINIQFNSIITSDSSGDNYGTSWTGPPPSGFNAVGNIQALDVLNAAFKIFDSPANTFTKGNSGAVASGSSAPSDQSSHVGAIVGGVVGAVIAFVGCTIGFVIFRRRRRFQDITSFAESQPVTVRVVRPSVRTVEPFPRDLVSPSTPMAGGYTKGAMAHDRLHVTTVAPADMSSSASPLSPGATATSSRTRNDTALLANVADRIEELIGVLSVRNNYGSEPPPDY